TPEEEARQKAEFERAVRKTVLVRTRTVRTAKDVLEHYGEWHAWRIDTATVESDEALEITATVSDWIDDMGAIWDLCSMSERLTYARRFAELCQQLEVLGYLCHMGSHRQRLRQ